MIMKKLLLVVVIFSCFVTTSFAAVLEVGKKQFDTPLLKDASFDGYENTIQLGLEFSFNWKGATVLISPKLGLNSTSKEITAIYEHPDTGATIDFDLKIPEVIYYTEIDYGIRFHKTFLGFIKPTLGLGGTATSLRHNTITNIGFDSNNRLSADHVSETVNFFSYWYSYGIRFHPKVILIGLEFKKNFTPEIELMGRNVDLSSEEVNLFFDIGF